MSKEYKGQNPLDIAKQAEQDLNSYDAKVGRGGNDSTLESGVNEAGAQKFPGGDVIYGSAASGAGDNRTIPLGEGGDINPVTGKPTKARDFEGLGGPEDKARKYAEDHGGADDVRSNIRDHSTADRSGGGGHVPDVTAKGMGKATDVQ
ncbi:hypothetical protein BDZ85DRAFT_234037 [Elsinoe ampelina]|uniref:Uncharacterized protein n=1 Tax=Elsinoe ampelina TaxID=302913 RepID=A0A6A6GEV6_9PEZI|nr:hypothetical protein BDZ85DRAFT_234037 [Elsinoe ampelina]